MEDPEATCAQLARRQHGLVTRAQALDAGMTEEQIRGRVRRDLWIADHRCVYRFASAPETWHQRLLGACLAGGTGSAASHRAAGQLWHLDAVPAGLVEIITPRRIERPPLIAHRSSLDEWEVNVRQGIPVTDPSRTLLDLAAVLKPHDLECAFESALRKQLTDTTLMVERLLLRARSGRNGVRAWRKLLEKRHPAAAPTESDFETMMLQLIDRFGLPEPRRQFLISDEHGRFIHRADFAYPNARLVIEADGVTHHFSTEQIRRDRRQTRQMIDQGWTVLRVTRWEMVNEGEAVANSIRRILRQFGGL